MTTLPNLDDLTRLAREATQGPWLYLPPRAVGGCAIVPLSGPAVVPSAWDISEGNAAFIAAASPAVVVWLCERVRALEQERDDLRKQVRDANAAKELMSQSATKWRKLMDESLAALARVTSQRKDQPTQPSEATNE